MHMLRYTFVALGLVAATASSAWSSQRCWPYNPPCPSPDFTKTVVIPLGNTGWSVDFDPTVFDVNYVLADAATPKTGFDHLIVSTEFTRTSDPKTGIVLLDNMGDHMLQFHAPLTDSNTFGLRVSLDVQIVNNTNFNFDGIELATLTNFETAVEDFTTLADKNAAHPVYAHFHPEKNAAGYLFLKPPGARGDFGPTLGDSPNTSLIDATMDLGLKTIPFTGPGGTGTAPILPGDVVTFASIGLHKSTRAASQAFTTPDDFMVYIVPITPPGPPVNSFYEPLPVFNESIKALALMYPAMQRLIGNTFNHVVNNGLPADMPTNDFFDTGLVVQHHTFDGRF
jgi:hypothetical protein